MSEQVVSWEYRVQKVGGFFGVKEAQIEATLNEWGMEGWEAVNAYYNISNNTVTIIAKRPLTAASRRMRSMPG